MIPRFLQTALLLFAVMLAASASPQQDLKRCYDEARSTYAMRQCNAEEFRIYDQALNESYRQLMQRLDPTERRNLREAQRAWIRYRDAECRFEGFAMRGGTGEALLVGECLAEMTQRRAGELRKILEGIRQREGD